MLAAHKNWLAGTAYMPRVPWKQGEREAFRTANNATNAFTTPIFLVPPAGDFDHELNHISTPADHVRHFGTRLFRCRRKAPVFVDARCLDDDRHCAAFNEHPLTALLERARLASALAWPLTSDGCSDRYQEAVAKAHLLHDCPVALQIQLGELASASLDVRLRSLLNQVSCDPEDAVLVINGGSILLQDSAEEAFFASLLIQHLNELPLIHRWNQIVFSATAMPDPLKLKPGQERRIRRSEWNIHENLLDRKLELFRMPIFSDCGVEYRESLKPIKARPSAKFNYTTNDEYFCVKGQNVKNGGYEAIYPVADQVVQSPHFMGASYSMGDERIWQLHRRQTAAGSAPSWRWAAADHHLRVIGEQLAKEIGVSLSIASEGAPDYIDQPDLFPLIPAK